MENQEMKFAGGMSFKARHEKAPETVRGSIYFKVDEFTKFLTENKDEKGWVNVKMMKSKEKGTIYFILDTWKPKVTEQSEQYNETKYKTPERIAQDAQNQKEARQISDDPLTDEELESLSQIPF